MQDAKEEVRAKLNIEDVIGEYVQLKRAGRSFKGLSPFSGEKTPSFYVSPEKAIWHDFSSNKGGDVFSFVMEVEGLDFRGALELLARKAGVDLTQYQSKDAGELTRRKKRLMEACNLAADYFQHSLLRNEHALEYVFKTRKLSKDIVRDFRIGYAPSIGDALVKFLVKKGFSSKEIADAGLSNRFGGDLFRGRMTVPLMDGSGQVIGFTARIIDSSDKNAPKYLNTPSTLIYDKGWHVFGLSQAKEAIRVEDAAVVVEGNLDVVSSHQAGVRNVVATAGTAMTEHHLRALKRLTGNIKLAFDGDKAGLAATERAVPMAQSVGVELTIITMPEGAKDADELVNQDVGLWRDVIAHSRAAIEWAIDQYAAREDMQTPKGRRSFTTSALRIVRALADPVEREYYAHRIASMTNSSLEAVNKKLDGIDEAPRGDIKKAVRLSSLSKDDNRYQDLLFVTVFKEPRLRAYLKGVDTDVFAGDARRAVAAYLRDHPDEEITEIPSELQKHEMYVTMLLDKSASPAVSDDTGDAKEVRDIIQLAIRNDKQKQIESIQAQIREAEDNGDEVLQADLLKKFLQLQRETRR